MAVVLVVIVVAIVLAAVAIWFLRFRDAAVAPAGSAAVEAVVAAVGARAPRVGEVDRLANVAEGLSLTVGVHPPELRVLDDPAPNALVAAHGMHPTLVVTTGLLEGLDRIELEGVVAHLLARVRTGEAAAATAARAAAGAPLLDLRPGRTEGPPEARARKAAAAVAAQAPVPDPGAADRSGVDFTRYPPGLVAALDKISAAPRSVASYPVGTAGLWLLDPYEGASVHGVIADVLGQLAPAETLEERIAILREH